MEYEDIEPPPWETIKKKVIDSTAIFVFLSDLIDNKDYEHTQNWISFEIGLACMNNKPVWVFEPYDSHVEFVVPYFTHYVLYNTDTETLKIIRDWVDKMGLVFPEEHLIQCPNNDCGIGFFLMSDINKLFCPSCRYELLINK